jgi:hypothetical protein
MLHLLAFLKQEHFVRKTVHLFFRFYVFLPKYLAMRHALPVLADLSLLCHPGDLVQHQQSWMVFIRWKRKALIYQLPASSDAGWCVAIHEEPNT